MRKITQTGCPREPGGTLKPVIAGNRKAHRISWNIFLLSSRLYSILYSPHPHETTQSKSTFRTAWWMTYFTSFVARMTKDISKLKEHSQPCYQLRWRDLFAWSVSGRASRGLDLVATQRKIPYKMHPGQHNSSGFSNDMPYLICGGFASTRVTQLIA